MWNKTPHQLQDRLAKKTSPKGSKLDGEKVWAKNTFIHDNMYASVGTCDTYTKNQKMNDIYTALQVF